VSQDWPVGRRLDTIEEAQMRNRILGAIGVLWGGFILMGRLTADRPVDGPGAYAAGQIAGLVFAALLLAAGLFYLIKGGGSARTRSS
jgi:hypothetical protein